MSAAEHARLRGSEADAELVASLFATRLPTIVMTGIFITVGIFIERRTGDAMVTGLLIAGTIASALRLGILFFDGRTITHTPTTQPLSARRIRAIESRFAASYLGFAAILGLFCARGLAVAPIEMDVLVSVMVMGYAAGVAAGAGLRPRIAVNAILFAVLPTIGQSAAALDLAGLTLAGMLIAFLAGGLRSMQARFHSETGRIAQRRSYAVQAQEDPLTRIANRRGLEERCAQATAQRPSATPIVVHCLDLDGFKPVNDLHGHDVGDALLVAVAARLHAFAPGVLAARLGGDEFALVQFDIDGAENAERAAANLEAVLSVPYIVDSVAIEIGASIGTVFGVDPLHTLLKQADLRQRHRKLVRNRSRTSHAFRAAAE